MSYFYANKIFNQLKENKIKSLKILLEEDEENKDTEEESSENEDVFAALDDEKKDNNKEVDSEGGEMTGGDEGGMDEEQINHNIKRAEKVTNTINNLTQNPLDDQLQAAADMLFKSASGQVSIGESYYLKKSIKQFIFEDVEEQDVEEQSKSVEKLTKSLSNMEDAIKSSTATLDDVIQGVSFNMNEFVKGAIELVRHFDHKFSKEEIIKKVCINTLAAHSGKNAERNIAEFKKLFHEILYNKNKIYDDKYTLPVTKTHIAVGAKSNS